MISQSQRHRHRFRFASWAGPLVVVVGWGCAGVGPGPASPPLAAPPTFVIGSFQDDYGIEYEISDSLWFQRPGRRYVVEAWEAEAGFLIARNHEGNTTEPALWTRIDWIELPDMAPWGWAFCLTVWDAESPAEARAGSADRANPREGCNGFPFSRMQPATSGRRPADR